MDYDQIPTLIRQHKERIQRCESLLRDYSQYGNPASLESLKFSVQIDERYIKADLIEEIAILNKLIANSKAAIVKLEKQHARLLKVSATFK